jgi:hypothetical protein
MTRRLDYNQVAPNGVKALGGVYGYVTQSGLPAELVELVYLRVSQDRLLEPTSGTGSKTEVLPLRLLICSTPESRHRQATG